MRKSSQRKLFLFGRYSLALLPPKKWLNELGVEAGDRATVEFDKTKKRLIVSFGSSHDNPVRKPSQNKPTPSEDGWQPIPRL
jgi:hypothetical protein